jgi:hypothetical protein
MSEPDQTKPAGLPWPLRLMRAQVINKDAEALASLPFPLFIALVIISSILLAFPFVNDRFITATTSANPALYPGLQEVFEQLAATGWEFRVDGTGLHTGPGVPATRRFGDWLVIFEPAGGDPAQLAQASGLDAATSVVFFGKTHVGMLAQATHRQFDGTWEKLAGFSIRDFDKVPAARLLPIILYASATGGLTGAFLSVNLLMLAQVAMMGVLMGFLLSLTRVHAAGTGLGNLRGVGFIASWKTVTGVAIGPALLLAVLMYAIPGVGGFSWLAFSLIYAVRVVLIYMGRFRNKKKPGGTRGA